MRTAGKDASDLMIETAQKTAAPTGPRDATGPRVVAMPSAGPRRAPRAPSKTNSLQGSTDRLLSTMRLVKRARFNAHERLEAKHVMSVAAFTFATVFEISLSLLPVVYGSGLGTDVRPFIDYAAIVTGLFLFGFGLVVGLANYQTRAIYLQRCAMDLGNLAREMEISIPQSAEELQGFRRRYHEIEARCPFNHSAVDLERAQARRSDKAAVRRAKFGAAMDIYGPYVICAIAYISLWATFWLMLKV